MKPKVFLTYAVPEHVREYIATYCDIREWNGEGKIEREVLLRELADVNGFYTNSGTGGKIDEELLSHAPHLKVVSNVSVGHNNFDVEAMNKRNVIGTNTPHVLDETVADLAFALILSTARRIAELDKFVKDGNWNLATNYQHFFGLDIHNSTIGIIGMGRIGEAIARRAKFGFNMDVLYHNRNRKLEAEEKYGAEYCDLESLLTQSDVIVLMTPLTPDTFQLIGEDQFKQMKKSAIFINVSRGQTVDEQALIQALENGEIFGVGLDVFQKEPVEADNPLLKMPNVVTVPHIGSATQKTDDAMAMRAAENMVAVLTGKEPKDRVWN